MFLIILLILLLFLKVMMIRNNVVCLYVLLCSIGAFAQTSADQPQWYASVSQKWILNSCAKESLFRACYLIENDKCKMEAEKITLECLSKMRTISKFRKQFKQTGKTPSKELDQSFNSCSDSLFSKALENKFVISGNIECTRKLEALKTGL